MSLPNPNLKRLQSTINFTKLEWKMLIRTMEKQEAKNLHSFCKELLMRSLEDLDPGDNGEE